jgi:hypothetical protein
MPGNATASDANEPIYGFIAQSTMKPKTPARASATAQSVVDELNRNNECDHIGKD